MDEYTLADLVRVTGAKRRALQMWADAGLIKAMAGTDRAGTGTHRVFARDEAIIAALVQAFAVQQMAIGNLLMLANAIRMLLHDHDDELHFINDAIRSESDALLVFGSLKFKHKGEYQKNWSLAFSPDAEGVGARLHGLHKPESFFSVVRLRTYLAKIDE